MLLKYTTGVEFGSSNDLLLNLGQVYVGHLAHAACNALFILELEVRKNGN